MLNSNVTSKALCVSWIQGLAVFPWRPVDTASNQLLPCTDICMLIYVCVSHSVVSNLLDSMDYSLPSSSIHGILQARTLEWAAMSSSRGSSRPRDQTQVFLIAGGFLTSWATRETQRWCVLVVQLCPTLYILIYICSLFQHRYVRCMHLTW